MFLPQKDNILEVVNDLPGKEQVCSDDHRQSGAVQLIGMEPELS